MLCDSCRERDAEVHLTKVVLGKVVQEHLCAACAAERGIETTVATHPKNVLTDFLQAVQQQAGVAAEKGEGGTEGEGEALACSFCGMTFKDFRTTGRLGCSRCYHTFEGQLRELLVRVHRNSRHTGRKYMAPATDLLTRAATMGELQDRLRRAILNEEFELAASLRDKIKGAE
jgi:protein arginine kinase activator